MKPALHPLVTVPDGAASHDCDASPRCFEEAFGVVSLIQGLVAQGLIH